MGQGEEPRKEGSQLETGFSLISRGPLEHKLHHRVGSTLRQKGQSFVPHVCQSWAGGTGPLQWPRAIL